MNAAGKDASHHASYLQRFRHLGTVRHKSIQKLHVRIGQNRIFGRKVLEAPRRQQEGLLGASGNFQFRFTSFFANAWNFSTPGNITVFLANSPPLCIRIPSPVKSKHPSTKQTGTGPLSSVQNSSQRVESGPAGGRHWFPIGQPRQTLNEEFGRNLVAIVPAVRMCKNSAGLDAK